MKFKPLTLAVSGALVALSGSAFAYNFADGGYTVANTAAVYISGSSATNNQLKAWAKDVFCDSTKQVSYNDVGTDTNQFAVVCQPKPAFAGSFSKANVAIIKNSNGGSGNGISKLTGSGVQFTDVFQPNPVTAALTASRVADIGVSDEEPAILKKAGAFTGAIPAGLVAAPLNVTTFGTPVTLGLRNALQDAQIKSGALPASCTVGSETEACMPSLSKSQIASIFSGNLVGWSELGLSNPAGDDNVYIARRVISSGTQTASRIQFLNSPCVDGVLPFVPGDNGEVNNKPNACNAASYSGRVFEGSGGGNVETCLTNHDRNGRWAIGINSLELPSTTDTSPEYATTGARAATGNKILNKDYQRHIKIDGVSPSAFNTATGRYTFWYEATMNTIGTPGGDVGALRTAMITGFNDPAVLVPLNNTFNTTALLGKPAGILAPSASGAPTATEASEASVAAQPLMYYTRSITGSPNSCQPAMSYYSTNINP